MTLENSLVGISGHFDTLEDEISALRSRQDEQTRQFEAVLSSTNALFEAMNNQIQALEKKLELEHKLQQNQFQDAQLRLRRQDARLNRAMAGAGIVLLLLGAAIILVFRLMG